MRLSSLLVVTTVFAAAAGLAVFAAQFSVRAIETASRAAVLNELDRSELTWAAVDVDGLQVFLIGTAPDEARRFEALTAAGRVVDAARVIDNMLVEEPDDFAPPRFSVEILRNAAGISAIGLVPAATDRKSLMMRFQAMADGGEVTDLLEAAQFPSPDGWDAAMRYATSALEDLPRAKISVEAGRVSVKAAADNADAKQSLEQSLLRHAPADLQLALQITAPRPVIVPFELAFTMNGADVQLESCSVETKEDSARVLAAVASAGLAGEAACSVGLGAPSSEWRDAVELGIAAIVEMGGGEVRFRNADIALTGPPGFDRVRFDSLMQSLENDLPDIYALSASLPRAVSGDAQEPPEFVATLSPEGSVQLRGRVAGAVARQTVESYARARFGSDTVYVSASIDESLPQEWSMKVLASVEALATLAQGTVSVTETGIAVRGKTGHADGTDTITALLGENLPGDHALDIAVTYDERLDPTLGLPSPEECEVRIVEIIGDRKIRFEPGSTTFDSAAEPILDGLAELLKTCGDIPLEIGGHTDSQGRESMNQELSQSRAQAVLDGLQARGVLVASYRVRGYGEEQPIADNGTETGREANRRIEFRLIRPEGEDGGASDASAEGTGDGQN